MEITFENFHETIKFKVNSKYRTEENVFFDKRMLCHDRSPQSATERLFPNLVFFNKIEEGKT